MVKIVNDFTLEYLELNSTLNDFYNLDLFKHLNHILPNIYSAEFNNKSKTLYNKYLDKLKKKKLNEIELELKYYIEMKLEYFNYNFELIPINHLSNIYNLYYEMSSGNYVYKFNKKKTITILLID